MTASIAALLVIFAIVSGTAIVSLVRIDRQIETINRKWLAGTQLLGDLKNTIAEFRVAEDYRFLAMDQPGVIQAEFLAERQATQAEDLLRRFEAVSKAVDMVDDFGRFRATWRDLLEHHRAWIDEAGGEQMTKPMGYGSPLQKRYEAVQLAANNLIEDARAAADAEVAAANASAARVTTLVVALSAAAGLLAVALMIHAELHVARPLGAITSALTRLADGDRRVRLPELHRQDEIGAMATAFEVFRRNAEALGDAQERAEALARHDALTGLANRRLFSMRLESALAATRGGGLVGALLLIDLDRFKPINDLHGHAMGDLVLREVAARLRGLTGIGTLVARLGGDEFAVILPHGTTLDAVVEQANHLAARIVDRLGERMAMADVDLAVGASVGVSVMPRDGTTAEDVLRTADLAMYSAKRAGRGTVRFFEAAMDAELRAKAELEQDLRAALDAGQIGAGYAPVVDLLSRRVVGYEARPSWPHPTRGLVPPELFVPLLDQVGGLGRMTEAILQRALADAVRWAPHVHLVVDVSARQLTDVAFPAAVANALLAAGFPPHRLEIEVAETALGGDADALRAALELLRTLGVRLVLGGFGRGRSSLSNLHDLPFDKVKVDATFVAALADDPGAGAIVDAVLGLAQSLGLPAVADGVHSDTIADLLVGKGCTYGQGSLFAPAGTAVRLDDLSGAA